MRVSVCSPLSYTLFNPEFQEPMGEILCSGAIRVGAYLHYSGCWSVPVCSAWLTSAETPFGTDRWTDTTQCHAQAQLWTRHAKNKTMVFSLVRTGTPVLLSHYSILYCLTTCDQMRVCFPHALVAEMERCGMTVVTWICSRCCGHAQGGLLNGSLSAWEEGSSALPRALSSAPSWLVLLK